MIKHTVRLTLMLALAGLSVTAVAIDSPADDAGPSCTEPAVVEGVDVQGQRYALSAITCEP